MYEARGQLTDRFERALVYATHVHGGQVRKSTTVPYVAHLLAVAATVLEYGGDEDMAIAGLLHDAAEDQGGARRLDDIRNRFGERVAAIVHSCSDSLVEAGEAKEEWRARKERYLRHLESCAAGFACRQGAQRPLDPARPPQVRDRAGGVAALQARLGGPAVVLRRARRRLPPAAAGAAR
jgi:hypothetical protein